MKAWESRVEGSTGDDGMGWGGWESGWDSQGMEDRTQADGGVLIICGMHTHSY